MLTLPSPVQGKYSEAIVFLQRAVAIREKAQGRNHPDVATNLKNWAVALQSQVSVPTRSTESCFREEENSEDDPLK